MQRLNIAVAAQFAARAALGWAIDYCKTREAFGAAGEQAAEHPVRAGGPGGDAGRE
jgi:alkylation response protein AidB-like acyl-CoA dehydrogenase